MQYFAQDPYLSWSTDFPLRILSHFDTAIKIRNSMKKKALKSSSYYDPSIIRTDDLGEILGAFENPHQLHAWAKSPTISYEYFKKHRTFVEVQEPKELEASEDNHAQMPKNFIDLSKYPCDSPQNLPALIETEQSQCLDKINEYFKWERLYENQKKMLEDKKNEKIRQQIKRAQAKENKAIKLRNAVFVKVRSGGLATEEFTKVLVILTKFPKEPEYFESLIDLSGSELIRAIKEKEESLEGEPCLTKTH